MQLDLKQTDVYLAIESPDFRKQIDGLVALIVEHFSARVDEALFIFLNRSRDKAKIIFWHKNGFAMLYKRLEKGKFTQLKDDAGTFKLSEQQFEWLLSGYDWVAMSDLDAPNFNVLYA